jgi:germination protein M
MLCLLSGCTSKKDAPEAAVIYSIDTSEITLVDQAVTLSAETSSGKIDELIELFNSRKAKEQTESALPDGVEILRGRLVEKQLFLYFNDAYHQMTPERELLCRAAVVKTFLQDLGESEVSGVEFFVSDLPLTDAGSGDRIGIMSDESGKPEVIGEVDLSSAYWMVHPGAVYYHNGV